MAKFYGIIGYAKRVETEPGVWEEVITEREYYGDLLRNTHKIQGSSGVNDNIDLAQDISIVADPYATENFRSMRYVEHMGTKWKITLVKPQYPRLILTTGGVYNGKTS